MMHGIMQVLVNDSHHRLEAHAKNTEKEAYQNDYFKFLSDFQGIGKLDPKEVTSIYQNVEGKDLLEGQNFRLKIHHPDEETLDRQAFFNTLFHFFGFPSFLPNDSARVAFSIQTRIVLLNRSILDLMRGLYPQLINDKLRKSRLTKPDYSSSTDFKPTFDLNTFSNSFATQLNKLQRLSVELLASSGGDFPEESLKEFFFLAGVYQDDVDDLDQMQDELQKDFSKNILINSFPDALNSLMNNVHLTRHRFDILNNEGSTIDLETLEFQVLEAAFETALDDRFDDHFYKQSDIEMGFAKQLFDFYTLFWENYFTNVLPMTVAGYFPQCSVVEVLHHLNRLPMINAFLEAGLTQRETSEQQQAQNSFFLSWEEPSDMDIETFLDGNLDKEKDPTVKTMGVSLSEIVFNPNMSPNFTEVMKNSLTTAIQQGASIDSEHFEKGTYLSRMVNNITKKELAYSNYFGHVDSNTCYNELKKLLKSKFNMSPEKADVFCKASLESLFKSIALILAKTQEDFERDQQTLFSNFYLKQAAILNNSIFWMSPSGTPTIEYFLWSCYQRPIDPLREEPTNDTKFLSFEDLDEYLEQADYGMTEEQAMEYDKPHLGEGIDEWPGDGTEELEEEMEGEGEEEEVNPEEAQMETAPVFELGKLQRINDQENVPNHFKGLTIPIPRSKGAAPPGEPPRKKMRM